MTATKYRVTIPDSALSWRFTRNSGPGGQHVNTSDTRVELTCYLRQLHGDEAVLKRITDRYGAKITVVEASQRSQMQNRRLAMQKLVNRLESAARPQKPRKPTKPSRSSIQKRLHDKHRNSELKSLRRTTSETDF